MNNIFWWFKVISENPTDKEINQFIEFLNNYPRYYKPAYIISQNKDGEPLLPTGKNRNRFKMYALDEICKSCNIFEEENIKFYPKTVDAIWYKKHEDGSFYIFLIEFKGDKLYKNSKKCWLIDFVDTLKIKNDTYIGEFSEAITNLEKIIPKYSDKLLNSLILKPLESITVSIPLIYEDYIENNKNNENIKKIDIKEFLRKSKIVYRVVSISNDDYNRLRDRSEANRLSNIPAACKEYVKNEDDNEAIKSYEENLKSYYKRYQKAGIIYDLKCFIGASEFNNFINRNFIENN